MFGKPYMAKRSEKLLTTTFTIFLVSNDFCIKELHIHGCQWNFSILLVFTLVLCVLEIILAMSVSYMFVTLNFQVKGQGH